MLTFNNGLQHFILGAAVRERENGSEIITRVPFSFWAVICSALCRFTNSFYSLSVLVDRRLKKVIIAFRFVLCPDWLHQYFFIDRVQKYIIRLRI
jgi:hypothetical protein